MRVSSSRSLDSPRAGATRTREDNAIPLSASVSTSGIAFVLGRAGVPGLGDAVKLDFFPCTVGT